MKPNGLIAFIRKNPDWYNILREKPYCLKITIEGDYAIFKYTLGESDFANPIVQEARGSIIWLPYPMFVCHPFDKFGNYGESYVRDLDWAHGVSVQEKIDGSLMKLWHFQGEWHLSTNGTIDAAKAMLNDASGLSFADLFFLALDEMGVRDTFFDYLDPLYVYMFELVSPYNRVVIPYAQNKLYYLGCRNIVTDEEETTARHHICPGIPTPTTYNLTTLEDVAQAANALPWDSEGYVCVDRYFNRCKVKSPAYVMAHYARANNVITSEHLMEVILANEQEEFLVYAQDYADKLHDLEARMRSLVETAHYNASIANFALSRKEFAAWVLETPAPIRDFLFKCYEGKVVPDNFVDYTKDWTASKWLKNLEEV